MIYSIETKETEQDGRMFVINDSVEILIDTLNASEDGLITVDTNYSDEVLTEQEANELVKEFLETKLSDFLDELTKENINES